MAGTGPYRSTYVSEPAGAEERHHSPAKREALRTEKIGRQAAAPSINKQRMQNKPAPKIGGSSLDDFKAGAMSARFMESSGNMRSLPTQVPDMSTMVNVNHLRATRQPAIWSDYYSGVRTYNVKNHTGNYNEEKFDMAYLDGNGTKMYKRAYETTNMAYDRVATKTYQDKLDKARMYARQPERKDDFRSVHRPRVNYINYADEKLGRPDHTLTTDKKGCFWVGTGAVDMFTTTNNVAYGKKAQHEYQKRNPNFDGKSRMLHGILPNHCPPKDVLDDYHSRWTKSEGTKRHEKALLSEYKGRFCTLGNSTKW
mmetsp:Transcript_30067/g.57747  ORF Transcript_30067/g.57747 Transcript_30067/m.57747 type:complete len:311 (+) Transcript_30067:104-1036(+)|eukprot:CAMPEP_0114252970 /NCGR_PEP_ID=MMETSP0058-20121206/16134_1 /TAXON_ID=36894 /ORGANISM="Pyramimonas parkeae, CCMP726" /LENGTH=310 /DNA_ID=CAMNT_0001366967 /DNA_START=42 /DNA_END=974 /DNA_ORIENTATION=-